MAECCPYAGFFIMAFYSCEMELYKLIYIPILLLQLLSFGKG